MNQPYFGEMGINTVALQNAAALLKMLEVGTEQELTHKQRKQALVIIEQVTRQ